MRYHNYFLNVAKETAKLSYAERLKVGAVAVKDRRIICVGFNGQPSGLANKCEDDSNNTLPTVLHAEENLILFAAKHGISLKGCDLYITHSPCINCSKLIYGAGFAKVFYSEYYRTSDGPKFLHSVGIPSTYLGD